MAAASKLKPAAMAANQRRGNGEISGENGMAMKNNQQQYQRQRNGRIAKSESEIITTNGAMAKNNGMAAKKWRRNERKAAKIIVAAKMA
jgi:hypothetical protein